MGKDEVNIEQLVKRSKLDGKTIIVTGANTGIGKETARELARTGARVILACRSLQRAEDARKEIVDDTKNENVVVKVLDLGSLQSVRDFAVDINANEARLDMLVNNAGVFTNESKVTQDGFEMMFGTNHLGHFLLTNMLLDKLKACTPSRIVNVSSLGHENYPLVLDDLEAKNCNRMNAYGRSKSANILFTVQLASMLEGTGVTTYSLHPGFVKTELGRDIKCLNNACCLCCLGCLWRCLQGEGMKNPLEGASTTLYCCLEPSLADVSGRYYANCKEKAAKPHATNPETAQKLWDVSLSLVGL